VESGQTWFIPSRADEEGAVLYQLIRLRGFHNKIVINNKEAVEWVEEEIG
jgi:hypothetical protein